MKKLRKSQIQKSLKSKLSLIVDVVKQGGGNTNTGNIARCFFKYPDEVSEATHLNKDLIIRFHVILQAKSCGKKLNLSEFRLLFENSKIKYQTLRLIQNASLSA